MVYRGLWRIRALHQLTLALAILPIVLPNRVATANEYQAEQLEISQCPTPGLDGVYPFNPTDSPIAHFYYIADVERCPGSDKVFVKHVVKNLGNELPFEWEGTFASHVGLLPGEACCNPVTFLTYDREPVVNRIRFGASGSHGFGASTYPLPIQGKLGTLDIGTALVGKLDTKYRDSSGEIKHISIIIESKYKDEGLIVYTITKEPSDLILAIGGLENRSVGNSIAAAVDGEFAPLKQFVDPEEIHKLPVAFDKEVFLVIDFDTEIKREVAVNGFPNDELFAPIAVFTEDFDAIATNAVTLLIP